MLASEITVIHELLAKYSTILAFTENNLHSGMDKKMADSVNEIKTAFIKYRDAIDELSARVASADKELGRHRQWSGFRNMCEQYEKMAESDVIQNILRKLGLN